MSGFPIVCLSYVNYWVKNSETIICIRMCTGNTFWHGGDFVCSFLFSIKLLDIVITSGAVL